MSTRRFIFPVTKRPVAGGSGPLWFRNMVHKQWIAVASVNGVGGTTIRARYDENLADWGQVSGQTAPNPHGNPETMVGSESGLCADEVTGEILAVAMGGHNDYYGNEGYAINLNGSDVASELSWKMCNRRTPVHSPVPQYIGTIASVVDDVLTPRGTGPTPVLAATATSPITMTVDGTFGPQVTDKGPMVVSVVFTGFTGAWAVLNDNTYTATAISGIKFTIPVDGTAFGPMTGSPIVRWRKRTTLVTVNDPAAPAGPYEPPSYHDVSHRLVFTNVGGALTGGNSMRLEYYEKIGTTGYFYLMGHNIPGSTLMVVNDYELPIRPSPGDVFTLVESFIDEEYGAPSTVPSVYRDGRPRAMHTVNDPWYSNGRVWFAKQNSIASGQGQSGFAVVSFDRAITRGAEPFPWNASDIAPWRVHGVVPIISSNAPLAFMPSCLDTGIVSTADPRPADKIWQFSQNSNQLWSVDTRPGTPDSQRIKFYTMSANNGGPLFSSIKSMWSVCIPGADPSGNGASIIVTADKDTHNVRVFRPSMIGASATVSLSDTFGRARLGDVPVQGAELINWRGGVGAGFSDEWGAVWNPTDRSILLWIADVYGAKLLLNTPAPGSVVRIKPPLTAAGVYDPSGASGVWTCDVVAMPNGEPPPPVTAAGEHTNTFSKFTIVRNFGGPGIHALVVVYGTNKPVYVCKLDGAL